MNTIDEQKTEKWKKDWWKKTISKYNGWRTQTNNTPNNIYEQQQSSQKTKKIDEQAQ